MLAVFLFSFFLRISVASVGAIDDLYLTCRGNEMAPAICDGDTVRVRVCVNGTLIQAGPKNSTHPGDIIVYCAAAAVSMPQSMWMCSRAVEKYRKDGEWCFKTQMDNLSEPDAWEVPEHYLLGVVDEVTHGASPQSYEPTPNASPQSSSGEDLPGSSLLTLVVDLVTGIIIGAIIGVVVSKAYAAHKRTDSSERVLGWFRSSIRHYAC
jgi:hypothetical protein